MKGSFTIEYYEDEKGNIPVKDYIDSLDLKIQAKVMAQIQILSEKGFLPFPLSRNIEGIDKLRELRIQFGKNKYRVIYFLYTEKKIILLHAFMKKRQKEIKELEIARKRMNKYLERRN